MTYGVLTILLGVVIFLAFKLIPANLKGSAQKKDAGKSPAGGADSGQKNTDTPEKLAQWVLQSEKTKTEVKERLCRSPVSSSSKFLFGRDLVLVDIFKAINTGTLIIELYGKTGVGKTSLAMEVVNRYKFNQQNILLYLDFGGEGEEALSIKDAIVQVVLAIRPTMRIPESMTQLKKLYQHLIGKRQGVFILDNVTSADQVKELNPLTSSSWLMVFMTKKNLGISEAFSLKVNSLEVEPAQEFLVDRSIRLKPRARETAKLCRGLPLALEMCGHFLLSNAKMSPADFVGLLRKYRNSSILEQSDEHEEALGAAFKAIYHSLSNKQRNAFNQLAVFPASFDSIAAAQICEESGDCLKTLAQYGLVKFNSVTKRYSLHHWVKSQLKNYLPEKIAREARLRHAAYYLPALKMVQENMAQSGEKARDGLQLFHREWANIYAAWGRVRKNSVEGKQAAELFNAYMIAGSELLPLHFFPKECQTYLEAGLKVSQRLGAKISEVQHLVNLGAFHISQARYEEAGDYLEQANQLGTTLQDPQMLGKVLNEMARLYLTTDKIDETIDVLLDKRNLCQQNNIEVDEEISLLRLGLAYEKKGAFDKAVEALQAGKNKARAAKNGHCLETILKHLGFCLGSAKDFSSAYDYFEASLGLARGLGKRKDELEILLKLGGVHAKEKDIEQALNLLREGLNLAEKHNDNKYKGLFLVQIGDVFDLSHDKEKAVGHYMKAMGPLKKAKETGLVNEIKKRLSQSFEVTENEMTETETVENRMAAVEQAASATKAGATRKVIQPTHKLSQGKALKLAQTKTEEFIARGDNKMISYYIKNVEEIVKTYDLNITDYSVRAGLAELMKELRSNNQHACATIFKNKFNL